jgi:hypothetical protein
MYHRTLKQEGRAMTRSAMCGTLWTVPHLTDGAGTILGQVIEWTTDLPTAAWITARLDAAVTHTDHSVDGDRNYFLWKQGQYDRTNSDNNKPGELSQTIRENFRLTDGARQLL